MIISGYVTQVAVLTGIYAIATLGFYVTAAGGQLSIAHGAFFALGAYGSGYVMIHSGVPLAVGMVAAFVVGGLASVLVFPATRLEGLYFAVASFAFGVAVAGAVVHIPAIGGPFGLVAIPLDTTFDIVLITLVVVLIGVQMMDRSPVYLAFTAVRDDPEVAAALGIKVTHVKRITLACGAAIAGLAGALYASSVGVVTPIDAGFDRSLAFLLMAIIGGSRSSWGAVLGAIIWTAGPEVLRFANNANVRLILFGSLAIVVLTLRPQGILDRGTFSSMYRWVRLRLRRRVPAADSAGAVAD